MVQQSTSNDAMFLPISFNWDETVFEAKIFNTYEPWPKNVNDFTINSQEFSLHPTYLKTKHRDTQPVYLMVIYENKQILGIASIYQAKADLKLPGEQLTQNKVAQWLYDFVVHPLFKNKKVLFLGSLFISGDGGNYCHHNSDLHRWHKILLAGFTEWNIANQKHHKSIGWLGIDLCFQPKCLHRERNHVSIKFEPTMELSLEEYKNFEQYKNSLKAKYRTKLNKAMGLGEGLIIRRLTAEDVEDNQVRLKSLFEQVKSRSKYYGGDYDISDLITINKNFDNAYTTGFYRFGVMIGFSTTIICKGVYIAHMIGMDYKISKSVSLYENILYHYIKESIAARCLNLNLGRTALIIKSGLGATPYNYHCCLQFNKCWWHKIGTYVAPKLAIKIPELRTALKYYENEEPVFN